MFRRRQTKVRKKTKYTILDNMDEQERVELRPKFSESLQLEHHWSVYSVRHCEIVELHLCFIVSQIGIQFTIFDANTGSI